MAAGDGKAARAEVVPVPRDGRVIGREVARRSGREAGRPLDLVPAVVAPRLDDAHLLPDVLAHVAQPDLPGRGDGELPRVAEPPRVDLVAFEAVGEGEGIALRDAVGLAVRHVVHVDAEERAEERRGVLAVAEGVVRPSPVAEADVEVSVGTEGDPAAVVVLGRLVLLKDHNLRGGVGYERVGRRPLELGDAGDEDADPLDARRGRSGVVDEDAAVGLVVRVEGEPEEPVLGAAPGGGPVGEVQEDRRRGVAGLQRDHARRGRGPPLLDDVGPRRLARRDLNADRARERDAGERVLDADDLRRGGRPEDEGEDDDGKAAHGESGRG